MYAYFTMFNLYLYLYLLTVSAFYCCEGKKESPDKHENKKETRYLLYDVNPPEGFNLRRDVYMRIAVLMKHLLDLGQPWKLVLPPWGNMYHWRSTDIRQQTRLPWSLFFDIESLKRFIPVIEMQEFLKEYGKNRLDKVYVLQHFSAAWVEDKWEEKMSVEKCLEELQYQKIDKGAFKGWFWGYRDIYASSVKCLSFQGHATSLVPLLINATDKNARTVMIDHAEVALHHMFGDSVYWEARRSMRFAQHLVDVADKFREKYFESTDGLDNTERPSDWRLEKTLNLSEKRGGNYLCVHLRRRDFAWGRSKDVPSIIGAAAQLGAILKKHQLKAVFVATDATKEEISELKTLMEPLEIILFQPTPSQHQQFLDGGVAIIEQIICSHAQVFYGTYESTFSFRIQEEREIMGFSPDTTFNRLCGDDDPDCTKPTRWRIEY